MPALGSGQSAGYSRKGSAAAPKVPQLTCELCRERKVKCDKLEPCTTCVTSGVECVTNFRPRLPRGRHCPPKAASSSRDKDGTGPNDNNNSITASSGSSLNADRSSRPSSPPARRSEVPPQPRVPAAASRNGSLESIRDQEASTQSAAWPSSPSTTSYKSTQDPADDTQPGDLAWTRPFVEPQPLRQDSFVTPSTVDGEQGAIGSTRAGDFFGALRFGRSPDPKVAVPPNQLCQVYLDQIDPIIKILHRPTLLNFLQAGGSYLGYPVSHASAQALSAAISYSAACSLSETQCRDMFQTSKAALVPPYRLTCEAALDRANFLVEGEMAVLQAFVLYLIGQRSEGQEERVWSLVPLATRIAQGMSLCTTDRQRDSFFDQQMRKRLWLTISVLDLHASTARGSEPLISVAGVSSALDGLRHVDDDDFDEQTTQDIPDKDDLTSVTFAMVTYHEQLCGRLLHRSGQRRRETDEMEEDDEEDEGEQAEAAQRANRERISTAFDRKAFDLIRFCDPESSREAWFTYHNTQALVAATKLSALRPSPWKCPIGERENEKELQLAFRVLDKFCLIRSDPRSEALQWYIQVPWHALAIAIIGCDSRAGEKTLRERWPLVEQAWQLRESQGESTPQSLASTLPPVVRRIRKKLGDVAVLGGGYKNAGLGHPTFGPASRNSSGTVSQDFLYSPSYTTSSSVSANYFTSPNASRAPSRAITNSTGSSYFQPPVRVVPGAPLTNNYKAGADAAAADGAFFSLDAFPMQGLGTDASSLTWDYSLFDGVDLQDEDMVSIENYMS